MSKTRLLLQCRLNSRRLPAKALLSVGGFPSFVLAARRAAGERHELVVVTSTQPADDLIEQTARQFHLRVARGPEDDVLRRFIEGSSDLESTDLIVRLTGDNTFPDAALIDEFCDAFLAGGARHLVLGDEGVPYGVYAEAISVEALRELDQQELSAEEREHVTLALRRRSLHRVFIPTWGSPALASLRATIDTVEDFVSIASIFAEASNPLTVPVAELCERLQRRSVDR